MRPNMLAAAALALVLDGSAQAQEAIATANDNAAPMLSATSPPSGPAEELPAALRDDTDGPVMGPCGPTKATADGRPDRSAHGQIDVGVGTGGYRQIAGAVCKPIGDNAAVSVAFSSTQWSGGRRTHRQ